MNADRQTPPDLGEQVRAIFRDCLFRQGEISEDRAPEETLMIEGIRLQHFALHPGRVAGHRDDIAAILDQMDDKFQRSKGGGWSFLNLCMTKDGQHWAEHPTAELLVVLAIGAEMGGYTLMPRELWRSLPGGVPYIWFDTTAQEKAA
jgi:hypothetical protein